MYDIKLLNKPIDGHFELGCGRHSEKVKLVNSVKHSWSECHLFWWIDIPRLSSGSSWLGYHNLLHCDKWILLHTASHG